MGSHKYILNLHFYEVGEFNEENFTVVDDPSILKQYKHLIHKLDIYKVYPLKTIKKFVRSVKVATLTSDVTKVASPYEVVSGFGMPVINVSAYLNEDLSTAHLIDGIYGTGTVTDVYIYIDI